MRQGRKALPSQDGALSPLARPPAPDEVLQLRENPAVYMAFLAFLAFFIQAVSGYNKWVSSKCVMLLSDIVNPSLEAYAVAIYVNGYDRWVAWTE